MRNASYKMKDCGDNIFEARVSVSWKRKYGKCNMRTHTKHSTLYTQRALKAWGKRNNVEIPQSDIEKLPKEI